jgi:hypothetical protein
MHGLSAQIEKAFSLIEMTLLDVFFTTINPSLAT